MIAIAGGGLAGLSAAYHLENPDWIMFEKSDRIGGLCKSEMTENGYTFDYGTHMFYTKDPYVRGLWEKLLGNNREERTRKSWVYSHGVYTRYPFQANLHGLPADVIRDCLMGLIVATFKRGTPSSNFEEWVYYRFGCGIADHFLLPYNRKLWGIALNEMSREWIEDRILLPGFERVIDGALSDVQDDMGPNATYEYPKKGGMEALPKAFLNCIDENKICCGAEIADIHWKHKKLTLVDPIMEFIDYNRVVYTLPLPLLLFLLKPDPPELVKEALERLEFNKVHCINYSVVSSSERDIIYIPEHNLLPHRIGYQMGSNSLSAEVSTSQYKPVTRGDWLTGGVEADLERMGITGLEFKSLLTLDPAYVIYTKTHREDVDIIHEFLRENDIYPCGRFGDWEYYNMDRTILSGRRAAGECTQL